MELMTLSLTADEAKAIREICEVREIRSRHRAVKIALAEYIQRFKKTEKHHRVPDFKLVECPERK